jgi:hypothetical protein
MVSKSCVHIQFNALCRFANNLAQDGALLLSQNVFLSKSFVAKLGPAVHPCIFVMYVEKLQYVLIHSPYSRDTSCRGWLKELLTARRQL